jgi:hypothetical protein
MSLTKLKQRGRISKLIKLDMKKGDITTNTNKIWQIIREYLKNLYSSKMENLEEIGKFLDAHDLPKLNQKNINHLNHPIRSNEAEVIESSKEKPRTGRIYY